MYNPDEECKAMIDKIKQICRMKNITSHALAKKANVSTSTISCLLSGKTKPQINTLLSICNVLAISVHDLFSDGNMKDEKVGEVISQTIDTEQICPDDKFLKLSDDEKEVLCFYRNLIRKCKKN